MQAYRVKYTQVTGEVIVRAFIVALTDGKMSSEGSQQHFWK